MLNTNDILETISMIEQEHLDIRTVTIGISLLDCIDPDIHAACNKIYDKICRVAERHVSVCTGIEKEYGIPPERHADRDARGGLPQERPRAFCAHA